MKLLVSVFALILLVLTIHGALAVSVSDLNSKLSDPIFNKLPKSSNFGIKIYGVDWGDWKGGYSYSKEFGEWYSLSSDLDFVVGVKEEFLNTVLQASDLCRFGAGLPANPDMYRVLDYNWFSFVWKYKCFSESGCIKKYCEG